MKKTIKFLGIAAILAAMVISMTGCGGDVTNGNGNGNGGGDTTAPVLSAGSVNRTSDTAATIGFTTNKAGTAYYLVQNSGAAAPAKTAVKAGTSLGAVIVGANNGKAVTLTAGAKDIYVVAVDASSNISDPLKIQAAAYSEPYDPNAGNDNVGRTGPTGGIIFYYSEVGFTMTGIAGTCHYLEASPEDLTGGTGSQINMRWSTATASPYPVTNGTLETIGSGKNNTAIIIAAETTAYPSNTYIYAARACSEYRGGGKDDWFLPSKDELNELYKAKGKIDVPITGLFWSSSQKDYLIYDFVWYQLFGNGGQGNTTKYVELNVRAVRAF
jgi:hypothetical protein